MPATRETNRGVENVDETGCVNNGLVDHRTANNGLVDHRDISSAATRHTICSSSLARALSHRSGCAVGRVRPRALWTTQQFRARIGVLSKDFGRRGTGVYSSSRCGTCVVFSVLHVFSPRWRFLQPPCPSFACDPDPSYAAGAKPSESLVRCPTGVPFHLPRIRLSRGNRCW